MKALVLCEGKIEAVNIDTIEEMESVVGGKLYKALSVEAGLEQQLCFYVKATGPANALPEVNVVNPEGTCHGTFFGPMLVIAVDEKADRVRSISDQEIKWIKYGVDKVYVLQYRRWVHTLEIHKSFSLPQEKV